MQIKANGNSFVWLDLLRIYCCICIILLHVSGMMTDYSYLGYRIIQGIERPALWAFLAITGFLVLSGKRIDNYN